MSESPIQRVLAALEGHGCRPRRSGTGWAARCPAHDDRRPSLSVSEAEDGRVLVRCHVPGCGGFRAIAEALGLRPADFFPPREAEAAQPSGRVVATYDYVDEAGALLFQVVRKAGKAFPQRRPDGNGGWIWKLDDTRRVLYRLPRVVAAKAAGETVHVVEGEKDVAAVEALGLVATCNPMGAGEGKWRPEYTDQLRGVSRAVVIPDCDAEGRGHADRVAKVLAGVVGDVRVLELDPDRDDGYDVSDFLAAAKTEEERARARGFLELLSEGAPRVEPAGSAAGQAESAGEAREAESGGEPSPDSGAPHGAVVVRVADVEREHVCWLWPGWLPFGKLSLIEGDPGLGKSACALELAARVTVGGELPDGSRLERAFDVVVLSAEDGVADTIRPRLEAAGADLRRVHAFTAVRAEDGTLRPPAIPDDVPELERVVRERRAALVIIDPLSAYLSGSVDSHRDQDVRRALHALAAMAERTGACVLVVRHLNKGSGPAIYRGGGSIGIIAAARVGLLVAPDPGDPERNVLAVVKLNLAKKPAPLAFRRVEDIEHETVRISWEGPTDYSADDLVRPLGPEERGELEEATDWLEAELAAGPREATQIEKLAARRFSKATLRRARTTLRVKGDRVGFGPGGKWIWSLPETPPAIGAQPPVSTSAEGEDEHLCETPHREPDSGASEALLLPIDAQTHGLSTYGAKGSPEWLATAPMDELRAHYADADEGDA